MGIQTAARELRSKMGVKTRRDQRVHWPLFFSDFNQNLNMWIIFRGDKIYRRKTIENYKLLPENSVFVDLNPYRTNVENRVSS